MASSSALEDLTLPPYWMRARRRLLADHVGDGGTDDGDCLLGVVGGGGAAGADGPDRLVGNDQAGDLVATEAGQGAADLALDDLGGAAGLALGQDLADADDRAHAGAEVGRPCS